MEITNSSATSDHPQLPPGFRFHPTDEELVVHYLKKKAASDPLPVKIIAEVDLYKFDPWELPSKASFGEQEWYFFSPRDRKYPNGARPNRTATSGYWKATGIDKPILTSKGAKKIGVKKALIFYGGKPPKGIKTNWIMHEYRLLANTTSSMNPPGITKNSSRLDDWVLCRIYEKHNSMSSRPMDDSMEDNIFPSFMHQINPKFENYEEDLLEDQKEHGFFEGIVNGDHVMQNSSSKSEISTTLGKRTIEYQHFSNENGNKFDLDNYDDNDASFHIGTTDHGNGSFISLVNQFPQGNTPFQSNTSTSHVLGDGIFHQPFQLSSINWNS